jgi:hypothetical protein
MIGECCRQGPPPVPHHADATALRHDLAIVAYDTIFAEYGVKTAW